MGKDKEYLGDGVYASHDGYQIRLTTEDGSEWPSNEIFLEPVVLRSLLRYATQLGFVDNAAAARPAPAGAKEDAR